MYLDVMYVQIQRIFHVCSRRPKRQINRDGGSTSTRNAICSYIKAFGNFHIEYGKANIDTKEDITLEFGREIHAWLCLLQFQGGYRKENITTGPPACTKSCPREMDTNTVGLVNLVAELSCHKVVHVRLYLYSSTSIQILVASTNRHETTRQSTWLGIHRYEPFVKMRNR